MVSTRADVPTRRVYLDHASTSPLRPAARDAIVQWFGDPLIGDPGRLHHEGLATRVRIEEARERIATFFGARSRSVIFTSGASEAIAAATFGAVERAGGHVVLSAVEHSAVRLSTEEFSAAHTTVGCDEFGRVNVDDIAAALRPETALVHVQLVNHETGTVQGVHEVSALCRARGALCHVDAVAGMGRMPIDFDASGIDLLSVSAHKMGGPTGIGALLVRRGLRVRPLVRGGDQERARRAGMENSAAIAGWAAACDACDPVHEGEQQRRSLQQLINGALREPGVRLYGPSMGAQAGATVRGAERAPHIACFGIDGIEPQAVLLALDQNGIAAHSGSACASEGLEPSPVLAAMGVDAHHSLRVSLGWSTTPEDIKAFLAVFGRVLRDLRRLAADLTLGSS